MKSTLLSIALLLSATLARAQMSELDYRKALCGFATDGTGAAAGLRLSVPVPCDFTREDDREDPAHVKSFYTKDRGCVVYIKLRVRPLKAAMSPAQIAETFSEAGMRKMYAAAGPVSYARKLVIDGVPGGIARFKYAQEHDGDTYYTYAIHYVMYHKAKLVYLQLESTGQDDRNAMALSQNYYDNMFQDLIAPKLRIQDR